MRVMLFALFAAIAIAIALSIYSYHPEDSAWSRAVESDTLNNTIHNLMGARGAYFADVFLSAIGKATWLFPLLIVSIAYQLFIERKLLSLSFEKIVFKLIGALITLFSLAALLDIRSGSGGIMGRFLGTELTSFATNILSLGFDTALLYTSLFLSLLTLIGLILLTGSSPIRWAEWVGERLLAFFSIFFSRNSVAPEEIKTKAANHPHPAANLKKLTDEEETSTIERIMNPPQAAQQGFFAKLFGRRSHEEITESSQEMLDITDAISRHEPRMSPQQDEHNELSYSYSPHEAEIDDSPFDPAEELEALSMNERRDEAPEERPIPSIFQGARKKNSAESQTAAEIQEEEQIQAATPTPEEESLASTQPAGTHNLSAWATAPDETETTASTLNFNDFGFDSDPKSWGDFIRHDGSESEEIAEPIHIKSEPRGIPSIFKNIFKNRQREESSTKAEPSLEIDPLLEEELTVAIADEEIALDTYSTNDIDQVFYDAHTPAPTPALQQDADLAFSISDAEEKGLDTPQFAIEEVDVAQTPQMMPLSETPQAFQTISQEEESKSLTPQMEAPNTITATEAAPEAMRSSSSDDDRMTLEEAKAAQAASESRYVGHDVDPRTGVPVPKKAEKEYPMAGQLPGLDLLANPLPPAKNFDEEELQELSAKIEEQLQHFNIEVEVANIEPGPVITRFELDLAPGVKIAQINNLSKDIARALAVTSVRIVDIIPGKPYVGLEIPNKNRETVYFKEGLYCEEYRSSKHPLTILLGKDVAGNQVVANLEKMPHLLIAGTTGSGKSVGINTILLSLLYKARPEELRLILIDPKMLELSVYEDIPHLLAPVVTDMKESANALRWAVAEMERRYLLMSKFKVRNIDGFNKVIREGIKNGTPHLDPLWNAANEVSDHATAPELKPLPYIVIVIDELADMMMSVGKAVEELIARLTQKARAAGIHLVVATQRPSVDVITGLIKANIPSRIAFQVSSRIDSRTVIDQQGAENLLGQGDMLYLPIGSSIPTRVHGAFVNDNEVNHVADFLRLTGPPDYVDEILRDPTEEIPGLSEQAAGYVAPPDDTEDVLFDEAVRIVVEDQRASISYLQRKLRIGYQRAARLIEAMEEQGFISPPEGNGNREILIK